MPRPYVLLSVAQSLDGYIDDPSPDRLVLSSPEDLDRVDEVRAGCDAIMVGAVTLRRDNPRLRVKSPERRAARKARGLPEELLRVIVTRSGKLGRDLRVWTSAGEKIIYCPDTAADALRETLGDLAVVAGQGDTVDLGALLDDLGARGIGRLMVEGGEQVHTQFLAADLADELHVTIGGFFVADPAAPRFVTPGVRLPQNAARRMQLIEVSKAGETAVLRYMVRPKALSSPSRLPTHATPPPNSAGRVVFVTDDSLSYARDQDSITAEAKLDGIYVLRTSVQASDLDSPQVVSSYKALAQVERAFRAFNTDLDIRPIRHHTEDRVRAHVFLRMLSYYISWHMQARLAPILFTDDDKPAAQAARTSPVAPAARSPRAVAKAATKQTPDNLPVHSLATLLSDLGTICLNTIAPADPALPGFRLVTTPTALQRQAFELLGVSHRLGAA